MATVNAAGTPIARVPSGKGHRTKSARNRALRRAAKNIARPRRVTEDEQR
jgi:hypothetical protein